MTPQVPGLLMRPWVPHLPTDTDGHGLSMKPRVPDLPTVDSRCRAIARYLTSSKARASVMEFLSKSTAIRQSVPSCALKD